MASRAVKKAAWRKKVLMRKGHYLSALPPLHGGEEPGSGEAMAQKEIIRNDVCTCMVGGYCPVHIPVLTAAKMGMRFLPAAKMGILPAGQITVTNSTTDDEPWWAQIDE